MDLEQLARDSFLSGVKLYRNSNAEVAIYHQLGSLKLAQRDGRDKALEEAALLCDARAKGWDSNPPRGQEEYWAWMCEEAQYCAAAIRKLKEKLYGNATRPR